MLTKLFLLAVAFLLDTGLVHLDTLIHDIRVIQSWKTHESLKVPSKISYTHSRVGREQWGFDIDDNAIVHKELRRGLAGPKSKLEELRDLSALVYAARVANLDETVPRHLIKTPDHMAVDFLSFVAEKTCDEIRTVVGRHVLDNVPVDLVVTYEAVSLQSSTQYPRDKIQTKPVPTHASGMA